MEDGFREQMEKELNYLNIQLTEQQIQQFYQYYQMLIEKNKVMNLTSITEEKQVITKHFVDSLSIVLVLPELQSKREKEIFLIDVGTGAGFPGIPIQIAFPQCQVTLLDSLNKRVNFLQEVCEKLGLNRIHAVHGRAEDFGKNPKYREKYSVCVSRAVAHLSVLSEYCLPFVQIGGSFIAYKSGEIEAETQEAKQAVKTLGGKIKKIHSFTFSEEEIKRSFVVIQKERKMEKAYPRRAGIPSKEPL